MTLYEYTCYDLTGYRNTGREVRAKDTHDLLTFRRARGTGENELKISSTQTDL